MKHTGRLESILQREFIVKVCSMKSTYFTVHCTVYIVHCTMYIVQCTLSSMYTVYIVHRVSRKMSTFPFPSVTLPWSAHPLSIDLRNAMVVRYFRSGGLRNSRVLLTPRWSREQRSVINERLRWNRPEIACFNVKWVWFKYSVLCMCVYVQGEYTSCKT